MMEADTVKLMKSQRLLRVTHNQIATAMGRSVIRQTTIMAVAIPAKILAILEPEEKCRHVMANIRQNTAGPCCHPAWLAVVNKPVPNAAVTAATAADFCDEKLASQRYKRLMLAATSKLAAVLAIRRVVRSNVDFF